MMFPNPNNLPPVGVAVNKSTIPAFNTEHTCLMCGGKTTWEARQRQAEKMQIFGLSIVELRKLIEFAKKCGYPGL